MAAFWSIPSIQLAQLVPKPIPIYLLQERCWRNYHFSVTRQTWNYIRPEQQSMSSTTPCSVTPVAQSSAPAFPVSPRGTTAPTVPEYRSEKWVTLNRCSLQLSPEQNYPKMTCLCHTFQLRGLASHLWRAASTHRTMHRTHCCGSAESCGHFLSWHLADRLRVTSYGHFRKLSYCEEQRFVCNERGTRSLVGAI